MKWFNRKNKGDDTLMTIEKLLEAYRALSEEDKQKFYESIEDVDEEKEEDVEKTETETREEVDNKESEEKVEEVHEEEKEEVATPASEAKIDELLKRIDVLGQKVDALAKRPVEADESERDELDEITHKWN